MSGLVGQIRGFVEPRAAGLVERGEHGPAVGTAVLAAAVVQAYDGHAFDSVVTPTLAALINRDADTAARALPAIGQLRRHNTGNDDPDVPGPIVDQALLTLEAAARLTCGQGGPGDLIDSSVAAVAIVERLGEVEALPHEQLVEFGELMTDPGYLTAQVPVTWREAARQVRAVRLADEHPDPWSAILTEADLLGTQVRVLAETLRGLRGPVSQAYPTVQNFDFPTGRATGLRTASPDLLADPAAFRTQVEVWADKVAAYRGYRRQGPIPAIPPSLVRERELVVAVPAGAGAQHGRLFDDLARAAAAAGPVPVLVRFLEVR